MAPDFPVDPRGPLCPLGPLKHIETKESLFELIFKFELFLIKLKESLPKQIKSYTERGEQRRRVENNREKQ